MTVKNCARCMAIGYTTYYIWDGNFSVSKRNCRSPHLQVLKGVKLFIIIYYIIHISIFPLISRIFICFFSFVLSLYLRFLVSVRCTYYVVFFHCTTQDDWKTMLLALSPPYKNLSSCAKVFK